MDIKQAKKLLLQAVRFRGAVYTLTACILWQDGQTGKYRYSAELLDRNNRTVVRAALEEIEEI